MIEIIQDGNSFSFLKNSRQSHSGNIKCDYCDQYLDSIYVDIIEKLAQMNLLPNNFEHMCCNCYVIKKFLPITRCPNCGDQFIIHNTYFNDNFRSFGFYCSNIRCSCGGNTDYYAIMLPVDYYD